MKLLSYLSFSIFTINSLVAAAVLPLSSSSPRLVQYVQTFAATDGSPLNILQLATQKTRVTHVILASLHLNAPGDIHLNDDPPSASKYDYLWPQVKTLQQNGVKVMFLLGGAAQGSFKALSGTDVEFHAQYDPLVALLKRYGIDGIDLDIEESVDVSVPLRLLQNLHADMGGNFIKTMAPVASALLPSPVELGLSGFNYQLLDAQATSSTKPGGKLVSWYNAQFYNGWGDASDQIFYDAVVILGLWSPSRVVLGVLDNARNGGSGFVDLTTLTSVIHQLRTNFANFGGVFGWEFFNAGGTDGLKEPYQWTKAVGNALYDSYSGFSVNTILSPLPNPAAPYPAAMATLVGEGASWLESVRALNITHGDVMDAQSILSPPA